MFFLFWSKALRFTGSQKSTRIQNIICQSFVPLKYDTFHPVQEALMLNIILNTLLRMIRSILTFYEFVLIQRHLVQLRFFFTVSLRLFGHYHQTCIPRDVHLPLLFIALSWLVLGTSTLVLKADNWGAVRTIWGQLRRLHLTPGSSVNYGSLVRKSNIALAAVLNYGLLFLMLDIILVPKCSRCIVILITFLNGGRGICRLEVGLSLRRCRFRMIRGNIRLS